MHTPRTRKTVPRSWSAVAVAGLLFLPALAFAGSATGDHVLTLSPDSLFEAYGSTPGRQPAEESTAAATLETYEGRVLSGPYFLRSADPEAPGELELKFIYAFERETDDEEHEFEFVAEWGMAEDWEFIFEVPVTLGEGKVEGNGDIGAFGFHTRLWHEDGWLPAFAVRNLLRLPTGYHSDGVDYTLRGLFTWTLNDRLRAHFNPFATSVNGNFEKEEEGGFFEEGEDERHFQWGAAIGLDFQVTDDLVFIADYQNRVSEFEGSRNHHSIELGADWVFAPEQKLAFQTEFEIDGDESGPNFGARIAYIMSIEAPRLDQH